MRYRFFNNAVLLGLAAALAVTGMRALADDAVVVPATPLRDGESGIVLLHDGGVLEGQITRAADWYVVGRGGGQLQIAASRVEFVGRSLHEAYEYRLQNATTPTSESHLALADWCLRYDLVSEAEAELATARSIGAQQSWADLVGRRIAATRVRLASKAAPVLHAEQEANVEQAAPPRSLSRDLPDGVVELFTRRVQPILVNNCTASKCHQPGGQQAFQLNRALLRGEANRKTTMQNLAATLALVNQARPEASPLLTVPRQTHGGMRGPIFGARQEQAFKHIADWVTLVAPQKPAESVANNEPAGVAAVQSSMSPATDASSSTNPAARTTDSAVEPAAAVEEVPSDSLRRPHRLRYGEMPKPWQPRDPFDPEIFNRAQRTQKKG